MLTTTSLLLALFGLTLGQKEAIFLVDIIQEGVKSAPLPPPSTVEVPQEKPVLPRLPATSPVIETTTRRVSLPSPVLDLPKRTDDVVEVPHTPIPMPRGGYETIPAVYKFQQPIVQVPKPIVQQKRVYFNVPQTVLQVPDPIIRHRPIVYQVPHILQLHRPIVTHERVLYEVPQAHILPKSGYN